MIIALNVKRKAPPYSSGAVSSERKLTVTILVVIVLSIVTFFPFFFLSIFVKVSTKVIGLSDEAEFDIKHSTLFFCFANSFVNPLVYTLRMKEFRKGARVWCGKYQYS